MKRLRLSFVILILVATTIFTAPVRSEESDHTIIQTYWGTDQPIEVSPGDVATLTIILRYESALAGEPQSLKADLFLPNGFKAVGGGESVTTYYSPTGTISSGSVIKLLFPIFITSDVEKGNYTADLELEYYISEDTVAEDELAIPIEVTGKPSIEVQAPNGSLYEGKQQISIVLSNEGDAVAHSLEIIEAYSSGVSVELEDDAFLGDLDVGDSVTVPLGIHVPTGMKGKNLPLTIEFSYLGPENVYYISSETLQLPVKPSDPIPPLRLNLETRELTIGESSKVYLDLVNKGSHSLSEIKLTLSPDDFLKIFGPTVLYFDRLGPGESKRIEIEVYVPSQTVDVELRLPATTSLTMTVTYFDEGLSRSHSETHESSMLLRGLIEISLTDVAVIPSTPAPGSPFSITFTVTNIGTATAYSMSATPHLEDLPLKTFGSESTYIGNVETNLPTIFTINLQVEENTAETSMTLPVILSYMDNLRSPYNVTLSIPITVTGQTSISQPSQQQGQSAGFPVGDLIISIVAVVAVAAVILFVVKKKRGKLR